MTHPNFGFIPAPPSQTDYIAGQNSPLKAEVRNPSGDWTPYLPTGERQRFRRIDTMACVSFSALNSIETQIKFLTGQTLNFSDRFLAKMSGTTPEGNYLVKVADTIRKHGLVFEHEWPTSENMTWEEYYADIPAELKQKAMKFLDYWDVAYEWIYREEDHITEAPIQVALPTCPGWNTPPVASCPNDANHAVLLVKRSTVFDSYDPYLKQLAPDYYIPYKLKIVIKPKNEMQQIKRVRVNGTEYLEFNSKFSYGIASHQLAQDLDEAGIPIEDADSVAPEKRTVTSDGMVIHSK